MARQKRSDAMAAWTVCTVLAAGIASAWGGSLKPVACDPADGPPNPAVLTGARLSQEPVRDAGVVSPKALWGVARPVTATVSMAVDYTKGGADRPDAIRIAFDGSGRFDRKNAIALTPMPAPMKNFFHAEFGPGVVPVRHDGKTYPAGVRGRYDCYRDRHNALLTFAVALQGTCRFGKKTHTVRFLDMTGNFAFDDPPGVAGGPSRLGWGDVVLIDPGQGAAGGAVVRAYYGQRVLVDGAWYKVAISKDGTTAVARPVKTVSGTLSIPAEKWEVVLASGSKALLVGGSDRPVPVPVGTYRLLLYRQWSAPDSRRQRGSLLAGLAEFSSGRSATVTVAADKSTKLAIGSPLAVRLTARPAPGVVRLATSTPTTRGKLSVSSLTPPGGWMFARPTPPTVRVRDAAGRLVDTVALKYARGVTCLRTWRVPEGAAGTFSAELVFDPGFPVEAKRISFAVK